MKDIWRIFAQFLKKFRIIFAQFLTKFRIIFAQFLKKFRIIFEPFLKIFWKYRTLRPALTIMIILDFSGTGPYKNLHKTSSIPWEQNTPPGPHSPHNAAVETLQSSLCKVFILKKKLFGNFRFFPKSYKKCLI